jgi:hypothetical protein
MGQQAAAIMVGIIPSKALWGRLMNEDGEHIWEDLAYSKHPDCGEDHDCIGFAATLSNGAERGEGMLRKSAALLDLETTYSKDVRRARDKWDAFAAWMLKEHNIELPAPTLLIAVVERA